MTELKFKITCFKCDTEDVDVKNKMTYGECEGFQVKCNNCGNETSDADEINTFGSITIEQHKELIQYSTASRELLEETKALIKKER